MLIIDEEQRFGVAHKERLKQLRTKVDVLTLSATPIPRTLHMSLSGVRDMSTINTPPKERLPIHTVLSEYDDMLVRQAIQRELDRNGQVFFVTRPGARHPACLADRIQHLVPEARGRRGPRADARTRAGRCHDALCRRRDRRAGLPPRSSRMGWTFPTPTRSSSTGPTTLAWPSSISCAGGWGAAHSAATAICSTKSTPSLSFDARRRLDAIMESSEELGAGFRIAMRDLEIRGAGDLLGARQHGHIDSVGFDLYTRLLAQAINEARRKKERFEQR